MQILHKPRFPKTLRDAWAHVLASGIADAMHLIMNDDVADTHHRLAQLNRVQDELECCHRWGEKCASDDAIIESLRANISPTVLVHHDRLRSRGRKSIAEVRHGVCSACHVSLPVGTVLTLKHQVELLKCPNCGSYIFLAADDAKSALKETH